MSELMLDFANLAALVAIWIELRTSRTKAEAEHAAVSRRASGRQEAETR
jgi:hypothetical protein